MSIARHRVLCMFCDQRGPRAREDPFAQWIARDHGQGGTEFFHDEWAGHGGVMRRTRTTRSGSLASRKVADVCQPCNNGWMSALQALAIPLLRPMMKGNPFPLWPNDQSVVSRWATMTTLTYDASYRRRLIPEEIGSHAFFETQRPLPGMEVWLGQFRLPDAGIGMPHARREMLLRDAKTHGVRFRAVGTTLVFNRLVIQTLVNHSDRFPPGVHPRVEDAHFKRCWPIQPKLHWPPAAAVDLPTFNDFI